MLITVMTSCDSRLFISDLNYWEGITIDEDLLDAAGLVEGEKVQIVNINNYDHRDLHH